LNDSQSRNAAEAASLMKEYTTRLISRGCEQRHGIELGRDTTGGLLQRVEGTHLDNT
jgi:hypothetical protein